MHLHSVGTDVKQNTEQRKEAAVKEKMEMESTQRWWTKESSRGNG